LPEPVTVIIWLPGNAVRALESITAYFTPPSTVALRLVDAGSRKTVRCAMPSMIITAARTKATMARTKRT
jgi:hypothetical protein